MNISNKQSNTFIEGIMMKKSGRQKKLLSPELQDIFTFFLLVNEMHFLTLYGHVSAELYLTFF